MATEQENTTTENPETDNKPQSKMAGKTLVLFIALPVILLLGGITTFFMLSSEASHYEQQTDQESVEEALPEIAIFYDLPEFVVNLSATKKERTRYLKMVIALEYNSEEIEERLNEMLPRIIDSVNVYARELRISDIEGAAGLFRLKEALYYRINLMIAPARIEDILFKQILVQ